MSIQTIKVSPVPVGFIETLIQVSTASELDSKVLEELKVKDPDEGGDDDNKDEV